MLFDLYQDAGYKFSGGAYAVPDSRGLGIEIDSELYDRRHRAMETAIQA